MRRSLSTNIINKCSNIVVILILFHCTSSNRQTNYRSSLRLLEHPFSLKYFELFHSRDTSACAADVASVFFCGDDSRITENAILAEHTVSSDFESNVYAIIRKQTRVVAEPSKYVFFSVHLMVFNRNV